MISTALRGHSWLAGARRKATGGRASLAAGRYLCLFLPRSTRVCPAAARPKLVRDVIVSCVYWAFGRKKRGTCALLRCNKNQGKKFGADLLQTRMFAVTHKKNKKKRINRIHNSNNTTKTLSNRPTGEMYPRFFVKSCKHCSLQQTCTKKIFQIAPPSHFRRLPSRAGAGRSRFYSCHARAVTNLLRYLPGGLVQVVGVEVDHGMELMEAAAAAAAASARASGG